MGLQESIGELIPLHVEIGSTYNALKSYKCADRFQKASPPDLLAVLKTTSDMYIAPMNF